MRSASAPASPGSRCCRPIPASKSAPEAMTRPHVSAPESLPSPRGAHLEMVGAVLAGDGLERIAEIASRHARVPVAVIVPRLGTRVEAWVPYERYVASRLAGGGPPRPADGAAGGPVGSGGPGAGPRP